MNILTIRQIEHEHQMALLRMNVKCLKYGIRNPSAVQKLFRKG